MKKTLLAVSVLIALAGCNQSTPYQYQNAAQPQYVQAAPVAVAPAPVIVQEHHSGAGDMLVGGAVGYMLGRSSGGGGGYHGGDRTTVNKTVVNKTVIVQNNHPAPAAAPTSYASAYRAAKPSTPSYSSRSSYTSSRSSFGSFRRR